MKPQSKIPGGNSVTIIDHVQRSNNLVQIVCSSLLCWFHTTLPIIAISQLPSDMFPIPQTDIFCGGCTSWSMEELFSTSEDARPKWWWLHAASTGIFKNEPVEQQVFQADSNVMKPDILVYGRLPEKAFAQVNHKANVSVSSCRTHTCEPVDGTILHVRILKRFYTLPITQTKPFSLPLNPFWNFEKCGCVALTDQRQIQVASRKL